MSPKGSPLTLTPEITIPSSGDGFNLSLSINTSNLALTHSSTSQPRILSATPISTTLTAIQHKSPAPSTPKHRISQMFSRWGKKESGSSKTQRGGYATVTKKYAVLVEVEVEMDGQVGASDNIPRKMPDKPQHRHRSVVHSTEHWGSLPDIATKGVEEKELVARKVKVRNLLRYILRNPQLV